MVFQPEHSGTIFSDGVIRIRLDQETVRIS